MAWVCFLKNERAAKHSRSTSRAWVVKSRAVLLHPLSGEDVGEHGVLLLGSELRLRCHFADDARPFADIFRHGFGCVAAGALYEVDAASGRENGRVAVCVFGERGCDGRRECFETHAAGEQENGDRKQRQSAPLFAD